MRIIFIGAVVLSRHILEKLISLQANVVGVLAQENANDNSDHYDLTAIALENKIPCKYIVDVNTKENVAWVYDKKADVIFCCGISHILKNEILGATKMGVVGFHPSKLPFNRGKHPIVWALDLGLSSTASTFFFMNEKVDSGDIISQKEVKITYEDDASSLYSKITETALTQVEDILLKLTDENYTAIPQDNSLANYWRKRTKIDGWIDFRMSSRGIYNLVRALTRPYIGAHLVYNGIDVKIWKVKEMEYGVENIECGKVLDIYDDQILVKCNEGAVLLTEHDFKVFPKIGEYLL